MQISKVEFTDSNKNVHTLYLGGKGDRHRGHLTLDRCRDVVGAVVRQTEAEIDKINCEDYKTVPGYTPYSLEEAAALRLLCRHEGKVANLPNLETDLFHFLCCWPRGEFSEAVETVLSGDWKKYKRFVGNHSVQKQ
jgi:hypothetical protein